MKFTQIPADTFQKLQVNAGVFCKEFDPATEEITGLLGATTGGGQFTATPEFSDFGEDIDNCPKNTKELKRQDDVTVTMSTTFVTMDVETAQFAAGAADVDGSDATHIIPRKNLQASDFSDVWWVGDYSDVNSGSNAGYLAIHLMNALSTGGFQLQSSDRGKGNFAIELTGHYSISNPETVPYEMFIVAGTNGGETPEVLLEKHAATVKVGGTLKLKVTRLVPSSATITWSSSATAKATVSGGTVTGVATGSTIITASITVDGVAYTDTCTVTVEAAS